MSRKRCHRRPLPALPPRGLRPRLTPDQLLDLGLVHHQQLDALVTGQATEATLWDLVGSVLTWSRVAELLQLGTEEMLEQMALATRLVERYRATGVISLQPNEAELARDGVAVMTELARIVDRPTAVAAADWSEAKLDAMRPAAATA